MEGAYRAAGTVPGYMTVIILMFKVVARLGAVTGHPLTADARARS